MKAIAECISKAGKAEQLLPLWPDGARVLRPQPRHARLEDPGNLCRTDEEIRVSCGWGYAIPCNVDVLLLLVVRAEHQNRSCAEASQII